MSKKVGKNIALYNKLYMELYNGHLVYTLDLGTPLWEKVSTTTYSEVKNLSIHLYTWVCLSKNQIKNYPPFSHKTHVAIITLRLCTCSFCILFICIKTIFYACINYCWCGGSDVDHLKYGVRWTSLQLHHYKLFCKALLSWYAPVYVKD